MTIEELAVELAKQFDEDTVQHTILKILERPTLPDNLLHYARVVARHGQWGDAQGIKKGVLKGEMSYADVPTQAVGPTQEAYAELGEAVDRLGMEMASHLVGLNPEPCDSRAKSRRLRARQRLGART